MRSTRRTSFARICFAAALTALAFVASRPPSTLAQAPESAVADPVAGEEVDKFAVPAGDPQALLQFIEQVAKMRPEGETVEARREHVDRASGAIVEAADTILAGQAADDQTIDAIEWKLEALQVRGSVLADREAVASILSFLTSFREDSRPAVANAALRLELFRKIKTWGTLDEPEREATVDDLVSYFQKIDLEPMHAGLLMQFGEMLADTADSKLAANAFERLLPAFREANDPQVRAQLPVIEGIARRLNLPGNPMELDGKLLDGTPLNWDAYRGKVVLVDFWATWCGPCRNEVPNVLANYQAYHEKGFDVLGISLDSDVDEIREYMEQTELPWSTIVGTSAESSGWEHPMAARYGITGIPRAILVDKEGRVVDMNARGGRLGRALQELLGDPAPSAATGVGDASEAEARTAQNKPAAQ